jgi:hypothetical protein
VAPPKAKPSRPKTSWTIVTDKLAVARRLQGQYLGLLRVLAPGQRGRIKVIARTDGVAAAVAELKRLLGRA